MSKQPFQARARALARSGKFASWRAKAANWLAEQACLLYPESNFSRSFETFGATRKQS
jgi:hypothetical protein